MIRKMSIRMDNNSIIVVTCISLRTSFILFGLKLMGLSCQECLICMFRQTAGGRTNDTVT